MEDLKVYKKGNYIIVEDSSDKYWEEIALNVKIAKDKIDSTEYSIYFKDVNQKWENVPFANILQENGTAYTDQGTFETWYTSNTGFNAATKESVAALQSSLSGKQDLLVSTTNIKTINGQSILGSGDLIVSGSGSGANLSYTPDINQGTVTSDTGTDAIIPLADGINAGLMSASEKTKLAGINSTGTNTGDQTSIVGITGTKAEFNTAVTDGDILYVGDVVSNATHTGDVTGDGALTIDPSAITGKATVTAVTGDFVLISDTSDAGALKKVDVNDFLSGGGGSGGPEHSGSVLTSTAGLPYVMGSGLTTYRSVVPVGSTSISSTTFVSDSTHFFPVSLKEGTDVRALSFRVSSAHSGGLGTAEVEFGIYNSVLDANGKLIPNTLEVAFGKISTLSTGVKEAALGSPHTLGATVDNIYWIAFRNYSTVSLSLNIYNTSDCLSSWIGISSSTTVVKLGCFYAVTSYNTAGSLPATLPVGGGAGSTPSAILAGYVTYIPVVGIR
jgi:hypothetical protein